MIASKIIIDNVGKDFTSTTLLHTINASFEQGKSYAITGKSGSGKSTLIHLIAGLDTPSKGSIFFNKENINTFSAKQKAHYFNNFLGLVFQSSYCIPELSAIENVMLPSLIQGTQKKDAYQRALYLLHKVGLGKNENDSPKSLSGGQQQRLSLARALMNNPCFLIADEPTGNLDYATGNDIINLMLECQQEWGMGVIVSSHDSYVVDRIEKVYELKNGILIQKR